MISTCFMRANFFFFNFKVPFSNLGNYALSVVNL